MSFSVSSAARVSWYSTHVRQLYITGTYMDMKDPGNNHLAVINLFTKV
jgi:hypothetical protein